MGGTDSSDDHLLVVPFDVGPLVPLVQPQRRPDEIDEFVDELFGSDDGGAGWFDVALLIGGAALIAWSVLGSAGGFVLGAGIIALALGCLLPIRGAWRRLQQRREHRRRTRRLDNGAVIDPTDASVARLIDAYDALLTLAPTHTAGEQSRRLAHATVLEVATLLRGVAPATQVERAYVDQRADAIERITEALQQPQMRPAAIGVDLDPTVLAETRDRLDELGGTSALRQLEALIDETRRPGETR